jgi:hypothetical protein
VDPTELERRRAKYRQVEAEHRRRNAEEPQPKQVPPADELAAFLDGACARAQLDVLRERVTAWSSRPGFFLNRYRMQFLGQLLHAAADEPDAAAGLADMFRAPAAADRHRSREPATYSNG